MAIKHTYINFFRHEPEELLDHMESAAVRGDGKTWLNLRPWVEQENLPNNSLLIKMFSAKGPEIPLGTWIPASPRAKKPEPARVGLSHSGGRNAASQLVELGVVLPGGWNMLQDHTKRGLIFEVADGEQMDVVLEFVLSAASVLSGVRIDNRWIADLVEQV